MDSSRRDLFRYLTVEESADYLTIMDLFSATLLTDLRGLVEPATRGDPEAPLLWTSRSLRNLAEALRAMGHRIGHNVVADLLRQLNYSLQANRKTREGANHPDRNAQFDHINATVKAFQAAGQPVIFCRHEEKGCAAEARKEFTMN